MSGESGRRALITGLGGQDGGYLAERLLAEGWEVHGLSWMLGNADRIERDVPGTTAHTLDSSNSYELRDLVHTVAPTTVFHLAGVSSVWKTWQDPVHTTEINALCTVGLFEACFRLQEDTGSRVRVVNASSGEIFAGSGESPQNERTRVVPMSPYGVTKAFGYQMGQIYRARGLPVSSAIMYNHESPCRSDQFVSRKISKGVAAIARGSTESIKLGNINGLRDWGWAPDVVDCLFRMAHGETADDYVVATGMAHTVREFVVAAFNSIGVADWQSHITLDPAMLRPAEPHPMIGDASKAKSVLGWQPTKSFIEIVGAMVEHDMKTAD